MELIQIGLYPDAEKKDLWGVWKRRYLRHRNRQIRHKKYGYEREWIELVLPANQREGRKLGENWFWREMGNIQKRYPDAVFYYTPEVCRVFGLAKYRKQWISWYFLFPQIWKEMERIFGLKKKRMDMVVCDTKDARAKFLVSQLIERAGRIEIYTSHPEKWNRFAKNCYEEFGLVLEFSREMPALGSLEERIIWDIEGMFYKMYPLWEQNHLIVAFGMNEQNIEYLRYRLAFGRVIYGYEETVWGQEISHKFSVLLMQSMNRRICQLARTEEIYFEDRDIWEITVCHQWKLKKVNVLHLPDSYGNSNGRIQH